MSTAEASGNDGAQPDAAPADPTRTQNRDRQRQENQILAELSATLNTLTSISEVLGDIVALTEPSSGDSGRPSSRSICHKQQLLLKELRLWNNSS